MKGLPERLEAAFQLIPRSEVFLDIGTDHAFLPIEAVRRGKAKRGIAADIGEGPLERAKSHIREAGLSELIKTRLSDGFLGVAPGEADTAAILGMGGRTIQRILSEGDPKGRGIKTLILGPQSEVPETRSFLLKEGYGIKEERLVFEGGKYYFLIRVEDIPEGAFPPYSEEELLLGRNLLSERDPVLMEYLDFRQRTLLKIRESLVNAACPEEKEQEVERELALIRSVKGNTSGSDNNCSFGGARYR